LNSTKDTAAAIFALADVVKATGELHPDYEATVALHGKVVRTFKMAGNALQLTPVAIGFGPDDVRRGENAIEIRKAGKGSLYYACSLEYYTTGEDLAPSGAGLKVSREYFRLVPTPGCGAPAFDRRPLGREVKGGEQFEVRVTVEADKPCDYFILEDFFPAGCEAAEDRLDRDERHRPGWGDWSNRERRDAKMVFFASRLQDGKHTFVYTLRAEKPGEYHVMLAQAWLMYQPDARGTSGEDRLTIFEGRGSTPARK
jgi:uncharacterized protein YfaS (alpha-2-macroglobulin family)